ncbi:MAG TPA: DUF502 domain-containing protein [Vicinamibacteria bacterium]|jgi:uncharacterized membrane protein|nr:DUF502 domain-containing protein [Vicinamibacteria bacterium]
MSLRRTFAAGLLVVLPLFVTVWVLRLVFRTLEGTGIAAVIETLVGRRIPGLGTALTLLAVFLVGLLADNIVGARLVQAFENLLLRVPVVRAIFGPAKQLFMALGAEGSAQEVVAVEYPRRGLYMVGFVTRREAGSVYVFLPTAPNPTSGFLVICREEEVHPLGIPFETAMRLIVSGGIVSPGLPFLPGAAGKPQTGGGAAA